MTTASPQVINDVIPRTQATAIADQVTFNTNWTANDSTDILVYARAAGIAADDQTQLVSQNDYNVTFIGTLQTVRVTFLEGRSAGDIITISRDTPASRTNLYTNTNFTPSMLNQDFGILTLVDQQAQLYDDDLAPRYNVSCTFTDTSDMAIDNILPILDANQFWVKNPANTAIIAATLDSGNLPAAGPFVTYTADASLIGAQDLGLLSSGILSQSVAAGTSTISSLAIPLTVPNGGSGATSFTAFSVIVGGGTSTEALSNVSGVGTAGQVLTSNGAGAKPTWQTQDQAGTIALTTYTSNDTYTKPANLAYLVIECIGGGGGGGGCNISGPGFSIAGAAGGGSSYSRSIYNADDIGATEAVTVGAAGTGGAAGNNAGTAGGNSSFGALATANGGSGGAAGIGGAPGGEGAGGAAGTGNYVAIAGSPGGNTWYLNGTAPGIGAPGGSSFYGQGAVLNLFGSSGTGPEGTGYGSGGGGGYDFNNAGAQAGGNGKPGVIIITEYLTD